MKYRHLSVGINSYAGNELQGCVNDARDWDALLSERGSSGTVLLDAVADRAAIVAGLTDLVRATGFRQTGIFTYSGHGTWLPDENGDEADGRDEALVPVDYHTAGMILDDDLYKIVDENRRFGSRLLIISDSCFSGTVERALDLDHPRLRSRARFLPPVAHLDREQVLAARRVERATANATPRTGAALLSGCAETEVSWDVDFGARANGAMSRAAIDTFKAYEPKNLLAWQKYMGEVIQADQHPQVQGTSTQRARTDFMPHAI